jgi:hypothetical protein
MGEAWRGLLFKEMEELGWDRMAVDDFFLGCVGF